MDLPRYVSPPREQPQEGQPAASTSVLPPVDNVNNTQSTSVQPQMNHGWSLETLTQAADDDYAEGAGTRANSPTATHPMPFISGSYQHISISRLLNTTEDSIQAPPRPIAKLPKRKLDLGDPISRGILSLDMAQQLFA